ncbi:MAG TPA: hypothetical protein VM890_03145 [Longimicrobium sp.]|nr:hypothetical protein [Longimicrobium sp.]
MIRPLLILCTASWICAGCAPGRTPPHGAGVAREALSRDGFAWRTAEAQGIHLHYLPGGYAAEHAPKLARAAAAALRHDLALAGMRAPAEPVELFLVGSREQGRQLTGHEFMGQAIPGELTAFFVAMPGRPPAFRHEIMHALSLELWGEHRTASWLAEGVAEWASGECQGHAIDAIASGFLRDGHLPPLTKLADDFWKTDELHAYVTAGSAVAFVARGGGASAVRALWDVHPVPGEHPLGKGGAEMEAAWRRHLQSVPPARIDPGRLRLHGCGTP